MLVLAVNPGEKVFIGDDIIIHYPISDRKNLCQIKLGFSAPLNIKILRESVKIREGLKNANSLGV